MNLAVMQYMGGCMGLDAATVSGEVRNIVSSNWRAYKKPILLSRIGQLIGEQSKAELRELKLSLRSHISRNMAEAIRTIFVEPNLYYAVPAEDTKQLSDKDLVSRLNANNDEDPKFAMAAAHSKSLGGQPTRAVMHKRFYKEVWAAFSRPINSMRRYLELREDAHPLLHEIGINEPSPPGSIEISSLELPPFDPNTRKAAPAGIADAVRAWARAHNIHLSRLYDPESQEATVGYSNSPERLTAIAKMRLFLEALEPDEVSRVIIPSEVLLKVLQRSGVK